MLLFRHPVDYFCFKFIRILLSINKNIVSINDSVLFYFLVFLAPEYDSPLFLDCCALVRRVLFDLKDDFGFKIGAWNQAYQVVMLWNYNIDLFSMSSCIATR